jgi:hypothetical protein
LASGLAAPHSHVLADQGARVSPSLLEPAKRIYLSPSASPPPCPTAALLHKSSMLALDASLGGSCSASDPSITRGLGAFKYVDLIVPAGAYALLRPYSPSLLNGAGPVSDPGPKLKDTEPTMQSLEDYSQLEDTQPLSQHIGLEVCNVLEQTQPLHETCREMQTAVILIDDD